MTESELLRFVSMTLGLSTEDAFHNVETTSDEFLMAGLLYTVSLSSIRALLKNVMRDR